jgi:hypothetical protein
MKRTCLRLNTNTYENSKHGVACDLFKTNYLHMKKIIIFSIILVQLAFSLSLFAQEDENPLVRKYSNEFLAIGVGARAMGMANTFVTTADDVTSGYWNPAGLNRIDSDIQGSLMHAEIFAGMLKYDYGAVAKRIDSVSTIGISFIRLGVDDIPNTIDLIDNQGNFNYDRITSFSVADNALLLSYARKTTIPGLNLGANFKIIHRRIGNFAKAWGFGLDVGSQYEYKKWRFGAVLRDATSTFNAWSYNLPDNMVETFIATGNVIPENSLEITTPRLVTGVQRSFSIKDRFSIGAEANLIFTFDGKRNTLIKSNFASIDPSMGIEVGYLDLVFLRAGVGNFQRYTSIEDFEKTTSSIQPNIGMGIKFRGVAIDYALTNVGELSDVMFSNVFSLRIDLNPKNKREKN